MIEDHLKSSPPSASETSTNEVKTFLVARELTQQITTVKFYGSNNLTWSKSVLIYIEANINKII